MIIKIDIITEKPEHLLLSDNQWFESKKQEICNRIGRLILESNFITDEDIKSGRVQKRAFFKPLSQKLNNLINDQGPNISKEDLEKYIKSQL